jgi:hypothetical protein
MKWYAAVTLYSEFFQQRMAKFTEPYGMLANSIFKDDEYLQQPANGGRGGSREAFQEQVLNGVRVGEHHYVRLFPVWFEFRGNNGTMLAEDKAIAAAAHLRGNVELARLAEKNLQWVVGRNPFVQSLMWGEGYDYAPQYTAMSGDIVGSLPVGIQAHRNADAPYWPTENCHNWKEVWVHPVGRWIWLMRDLAGLGELQGDSGGPVQIREVSSGHVIRMAAGRFHAALPMGDYEVTAGAQKRLVTVLPGETVPLGQLDLRVAASAGTIRAVLTGVGEHSVELRGHNLSVGETVKKVTLQAGTPQTVEWKTTVSDGNAPWIAVVIADHDAAQRREIVSK